MFPITVFWVLLTSCLDLVKYSVRFSVLCDLGSKLLLLNKYFYTPVQVVLLLESLSFARFGHLETKFVTPGNQKWIQSEFEIEGQRKGDS